MLIVVILQKKLEVPERQHETVSLTYLITNR